MYDEAELEDNKFWNQGRLLGQSEVSALLFPLHQASKCAASCAPVASRLIGATTDVFFNLGRPMHLAVNACAAKVGPAPGCCWLPPIAGPTVPEPGRAAEETVRPRVLPTGDYLCTF